MALSALWIDFDNESMTEVCTPAFLKVKQKTCYNTMGSFESTPSFLYAELYLVSISGGLTVLYDRECELAQAHVVRSKGRNRLESIRFSGYKPASNWTVHTIAD